MNEIDRILWMMTPVELGLYAAIGGSIPPSLMPRLAGVCPMEHEWYRPRKSVPFSKSERRTASLPRLAAADLNRPVACLERPSRPVVPLARAARLLHINPEILAARVEAGQKCHNLTFVYAAACTPCPQERNVA